MGLAQTLAFAPVFFLIGLVQAYLVALFYGGKGARDKSQREVIVTSAMPFICVGFGLFVGLSYVALPEPWARIAVVATGAVLLAGLARGMRRLLVQEGWLGPQGDRWSMGWAALGTVVWVVMLAHSVPLEAG